MRSYERSGVTVDQCADCRGVFLDRGELERVIDAEGSYYEERGFRGRGDDDDDDYREREHFGGFGGGRKRRGREGFLGELFD
jgi:Zn-finger nucleic acid-binding protein